MYIRLHFKKKSPEKDREEGKDFSIIFFCNVL